MNRAKRFGSFWYHFIVGDDWRIAGGVVTGLALTWLLTHSLHWQTWWFMPILVVAILTLSLWTATRNK